VGKQAADCQHDGSWMPKELPTCVCKYLMMIIASLLFINLHNFHFTQIKRKHKKIQKKKFTKNITQINVHIPFRLKIRCAW
jgi:hypothetical protein